MGAFCHVLLFGGRGRAGWLIGACMALAVMSEALDLPDGGGWMASNYKVQEKCAWVPSGNSEEMIHFQHHFTQDDLITLCEWTVPSMRTWQARRVEVWHVCHCMSRMHRREIKLQK